MYKVCGYCGAHLDPGERCDCQDEAAALAQNDEEQATKNAPYTECVAV